MPAHVTPDNVLQKLKQLNTQHEKAGNSNRAIGVDTLALLFNKSFDEMEELLQQLQDQGHVSMTYVTDGKKTGKNKVMLVSLLK